MAGYYQTPYYGQPTYQQPQQTMQQQPQIVNAGFISVRNEQEARNYPIAHGNSLTFKDENAPYVYTKTVGFSQMDVPVFEKYRLIRETDLSSNNVSESSPTNNVPKHQKDEIGTLKKQIEDIKKDVAELMDFKSEFGGDDDAE